MNILFITSHLNAGGITSYLMTLSKGMIAKGHSVHIISAGGGMENYFRGEGVYLSNSIVRTKSIFNVRLYTALPNLVNYVKRNDIDVIHSHTRVTQVIGRLLGSITQKVYVSTCHGFFKRRLGRRLFGCWGDGVVAISEAVYGHLINDFKVKESKLHLVESGVDCDYFSERDEKAIGVIKEKYSLANKTTIGLVARYSDVKGQDILVKAMAKVVLKNKNIKLLLVGEGKLESYLKELVEENNLSTYIQFIPVVNQAKHYLHAFDITVIPSRQEGLGLSVLEAQAASCPVIGSNVGGIPQIITDKQTGVLVEKENVETLAEAIVSLSENTKYCEQLSTNALVSVREKFGVNKMIVKTIAVYEDLVKQAVL
ncbi:MAG: glycosyltransferase involved in cell wall biosynthesis [Candidatus Omnitrophota bacterium]|jgi:glycosyltransferase involved in cell wall biosynthesis